MNNLYERADKALERMEALKKEMKELMELHEEIENEKMSAYFAMRQDGEDEFKKEEYDNLKMYARQFHTDVHEIRKITSL